MKYVEGAIEQGEEVTVLGRGRWETNLNPNAEASGYRTVPRRLVIDAPDDGDLFLSDDPRTLD